MRRFARQWSMNILLAVSAVAVSGAAGAQELEPEFEFGSRPRCEPGGSLFAPGEISLEERSEYRLALSADGKTAYYHVDTDTPPYQAIYVTQRKNGHWGPGEVVSFSGTYKDSDPFLSPDGQSLFYSSTRPVNGGAERPDTDLWVVHRVRDGWGTPEHLGPLVNSPREELYPSVTRDGTVYFASGTFETDFEMYRVRRQGHHYTAPENLGPAVNTPDSWEYNPWVSPDGRVLVFASLNRPGGYGLGDLYVSFNVAGTWTPAANLGPAVNTEKDEFHPTLSRDLGQLYFVRQTWDPFVPSDLYHLDTRCLWR
ncbi:Xaa-Pro aminopeptidase-like protein [Corallococcus coralloides]|uniref:Xaa-Pro aminopeptidase-like protein n=1 Tax=Corallococcus coralloides TaxID=184914 RepID=A0A410RPJ8_CORCK|nr:PD40 domain-containing protein [Corallococcus coralloides]QAT83775.1 Xaa-Pro aminopeptidase-like protein [Corallococcus coralloides]